MLNRVSRRQPQRANGRDGGPIAWASSGAAGL